MPKMKTHKGTAKRVRVTATGKIMVRSFNPKRAKRARPSMYGNREDRPAHATLVDAIRTNRTPRRRPPATSRTSPPAPAGQQHSISIEVVRWPASALASRPATATGRY